MDISDEQRQQFATLLKRAVETTGLPQYKLAEAAGVDRNVIALLLRDGPYVSLRARDLFRLVAYLRLDIIEVARLMGYSLPTGSVEASRLRGIVRTFDALSEDEQTWALGVFDAVLRGLRK